MKKKRVKDPVCSHLKKLISPYGFGRAENGKVGRYTNDQLIRFYNKSGFMGSPSNGELYSHFAGQTTLYFWADGRMSSPGTLSMIDIDCHGRGNARSAGAFADWLAENHFTGLYHEPSTHGIGGHGYFVLSKEGCNDRGVSHILKRLDKTLKKLLRSFLATHPEYEVENVEIKGTPHLITWAQGAGRQIETMKSGDLAKLPRQILDRFEEFKGTTVLSFRDIEDLESNVEALVIPDSTRLPVIKVGGSAASHPIGKDEIEAIGGPYLAFAETWIDGSVGTSSRARVEPADLAIALPIVKFCSRRRNPDGTMPTARIKGIWDRLFEDGDVDRAFDYHRWRVIRDLIETQGGLEMDDRRYFTGFVNELGGRIRGRAAKWRMADWLADDLDRLVETGSLDALQDVKECEICREDPSMRSEALGQADPESLDGIAGILPMGGRERASLEQEESIVRGYAANHAGSGGRERASLEQDDFEGIENLFDRGWIIEFRRSEHPMIGLIWAGSLGHRLREAG